MIKKIIVFLGVMGFFYHVWGMDVQNDSDATTSRHIALASSVAGGWSSALLLSQTESPTLKILCGTAGVLSGIVLFDQIFKTKVVENLFFFSENSEKSIQEKANVYRNRKILFAVLFGINVVRPLCKIMQRAFPKAHPSSLLKFIVSIDLSCLEFLLIQTAWDD
jgi:hypothetical protein